MNVSPNGQRVTAEPVASNGWSEELLAYWEAAARFRRSAKRHLRRTAHHEAGHAVAAHFLRLPFSCVAVRPLSDTDPDAETPGYDDLDEAFGEFTNGTVKIPEIRRSTWYRSSKTALVIILAGPMAEFRFAGSKGQARIKDKDRDDASAMAVVSTAFRTLLRGEDLATNAERAIERAKVQALELVDRRWPEIQAVAHALIEKKPFRFLTRRDVGKIIQGVAAQG